MTVKHCASGLLLTALWLVATAASAAVPEGWQEFRHSSGAVLSHPPDWQVSEQPGGLVLQPSDPQLNELIVATGMAANGLTDPASEQVANYLDFALTQTVPGIRRIGAPESVAAARGEGALYRYTAATFDGTEITSHVYVTIQDDIAFSLSAVGTPDVIARRLETLEQIFGSMSSRSAGAGGASANASSSAASGGSSSTGDDPRLVGMFAGEAIAGGGDSGIYVNTRLVYVLNPDGTLHYGAQSHFSASDRDYNGDLIYTASGSSDGSVESGRWSAGNGFLTINWDSGQRSYFAYGFEPDGSLVLRNPQTRKLINFYSRVR